MDKDHRILLNVLSCIGQALQNKELSGPKCQCAKVEAGVEKPGLGTDRSLPHFQSSPERLCSHPLS